MYSLEAMKKINRKRAAAQKRLKKLIEKQNKKAKSNSKKPRTRSSKKTLHAVLARAEAASPLKMQVGGSHYKGLQIQPVEYIQKNKIPFMEGSAIKYLTRWRDKGGIEDLKKAKHFIEMLIEFEEQQA